jgi:S-DNA-T family DNA segregation ATPase FtsK/SpoIIIE
VVCLAAGLLCLLCLVSYHVQDGSWNTAAGTARPLNLAGKIGSHVADLMLQTFGSAAFLFPLLALILSWKWLRSESIEAPLVKTAGWIMLMFTVCAGASLIPNWRLFDGVIVPGGGMGSIIAEWMKSVLNLAGAAIILVTSLIVSVYLISSFTLSRMPARMAWLTWPIHVGQHLIARFRKYLQDRATRNQQAVAAQSSGGRRRKVLSRESEVTLSEVPSVHDRLTSDTLTEDVEAPVQEEIPVMEGLSTPFAEFPAELSQIPIRRLADVTDDTAPWSTGPMSIPRAIPQVSAPDLVAVHHSYRLPPTTLLNDPEPRSAFDEMELKTTAALIKAKFEEFNVLGSVVQINPGPVVTTFEFKPEAGMKYSKITNLTEDLCLGLQAESILIERIPGKPTVGIEVPNTRRELISLRAVLESSEFAESRSMMTISMGKDINGRIKVAALDVMPHLLIAGSTGSGKSVMINTLVMSVLYKATPDDVRMILIDPKRVELGVYEGIPHLLTPVITDPRKATIALKNAVLEMERRLRLLAEQGARNIEQFNRKVKKLQEQPRDLFEEPSSAVEELRPLPFILILIDELADLMMLEGRNVEESVTRLAQMARAVGMHLVLATQRPSVDVITGLIKANFPARISFRVATRVDSRTILDVMGSEHLLGKGDMLFLPPGSSRLTRVHGAFVTESEINEVVEFWKEQAVPEYDQSFLLAPPETDGEPEAEPANGEQDPMYEEAIRVVLEMGKASTSTLQRRLRLGYGRAARILDMMHRDGIIGPPDGSRPREVLKPPSWLKEVEAPLG